MRPHGGWRERVRTEESQAGAQPAYMAARDAVRARWHLPYWYLHRIVGGLIRLSRALPRVRQADRGAR